MMKNLVVILGPTASGKTRLAVRLARDLKSEIVSADSRQVYRGMDIGTGKDLDEYRIDGEEIPCHLIDIVDPDYDFNVFEYQSRFYRCFEEILSRGIVPILVGGTGLYLSAVLENYRMVQVPENLDLRESLKAEPLERLQQILLEITPRIHNTTDLLDRGRLLRAIEIAQHSGRRGLRESPEHPRIEPLVFGVRWNRDLLRKRIALRLKERLSAGLIDEVKELHQSGISWDRLEFFGLEYRYVGLYLQSRMSYREMAEKLTIHICRFAKRQETWFRRMERHGIEIIWIEGDDYEALKEQLKGNLRS
ncbi:tRNA (adenosine(37)-N6)-dimethylallyltransferase MiaA [Syntrophus aciditrophicus]|mgnify:FL=1|uniref:tRNA dimethylallyltransferase 1 n=1 Tax=Syntrophus aciditrophicus (strain SB) TaxID=56780 RepID=MIAA1_SYNAS|nr:tRNA (adenosine(37)-N6)-dimethylallyltransferase MiaA [Syntrophus aciditrophicus]Q2LTI8.1 RecName: Full=tRNA dimethylallyltransferase 1; AltName: Full=Dimethylallyl diphosphate:tRNA dimethylallyltransferase 1; Short=DMAPP:tRNA dimethylallyltransferase 1; Short=DMATase 1; AltName: Full=Isopentenyl-diphosphate:tRNA isopentenyltransferase 1; Short=IPP transferase 1; Short=IPPT 1; Short=IPTase 1 [Syntrophus aciditrophicus SB]ABC77399.1 tRNA delta(2)-isopentenylpyrophosphate transferase [Syntrophus